jgi:dipeptidyl aminopeptidase/acylaminoacyl peptidase
VSTAEGSQPRRLTFDRANDRSPKWAADGKTIYFLANRKREAEHQPPWDGATQVWRIDIASGEPQAVTRVSGGVSSYDLATKEGGLFYSVDKSVTDQDEFTTLRSRFDKAEYGHGKRTVSEIWRLNLETWRSELVIDEQRFVREFAVTADGRRLAMVSAFDNTVLKSEGESRVDIWEDGQVATPPTSVYRGQAASPHAWLESPAWSPDGRKFAFCAIFDAHPAEIVIGARTDTGWTMELMKRPPNVHVHGYGSPLKWHPSGSLFFLAELAAKTIVVPSDLEILERLSNAVGPDHVAYGFDTDAGGRVGVFLLGRPDQFPDLHLSRFEPGAPFRRLTSLNPQTGDWKLPAVKHITWKAADGAGVGGVLELPPDYEPGVRIPLIVGIHGGPTSAASASLEFDPYLGRIWLPVKGYAVLCPNYRGSTGYGDKFLTDLIGNENEVDVSDIVAGVRHLVQEGIVDPDRVGIMGWSNGGYLTNCLLTKKGLPFRLRAASSGASILDTVMEWGINDEPAYPKVFKQGLPWETPDVYRKTSPTYGLGNVTGPTLIHVGGADERCPPEHSRMLYRALREYVKVPTELVVYPGEPHGLTKYSSRKAKMEWDLAWFEKYVKENGTRLTR